LSITRSDVLLLVFFFFQAEDGIRDFHVTGVQTCALPIYNFSVVAEAGDGMEAVALMEKHEIDIVLLDIRMPKRNGVETTKLIKKRWPHVKILVLTTFNDDEAALQTLKDGANGILLKTADPEKLIQAVHSCLEGGLVLNEEVAAKMMPKLLDDKKLD